MANPSEIADVVELWVWADSKPMTLSQLGSHLETAIPAENIDLSDGVSAEEPFEVLAQQVFDEIVQRTRTLKQSYPFRCNGMQLEYCGDPQATFTYIFCLLLSHLGPEFIHNNQRAVQFETVAMHAAHAFFGGSALRIGAPWETATYRELLDNIIGLIPNLHAVDLTGPVTGGDKGWDILVVKGFSDDQFPRFVALGNCATGRKDWKRKGSEVQPDYFWDSFRHRRPGVIVTFSAVPFKMSDDLRMRKTSASNLTLDRFRICEMAPFLSGDASLWVAEQRTNAGAIALDNVS